MKGPETTFYLVRHGETQWNVGRRMQGHSDSELTELGRQQALRLRERFRDVCFDRVLSSDMPRAVKTARLIIGDAPLEIVTTSALRERNYGPFEGRPVTEYQTELKDRLAALKTLSKEERWSFRLTSGMETNQEITERFLSYIDRAAGDYPGETILIVSHGAVMKYSVARLGIERFHDPDLMISNGCYIQVVHDGERFKVTEMMGVD